MIIFATTISITTPSTTPALAEVTVFARDPAGTWYRWTYFTHPTRPALEHQALELAFLSTPQAWERLHKSKAQTLLTALTQA